MADDPTVTMAVLRDGYWAGTYAQAGDVIQVPAALVDTLQLNGFAVRQAPSEPARLPKGSKHGASR